jgi:hypothetical protein
LGKFAHCGDENKNPLQIAQRIFWGKNTQKSPYFEDFKKRKKSSHI